jgi:hypothetical protein
VKESPLSSPRRLLSQQLSLVVERVAAWTSESQYLQLVRFISTVAIAAGVVARVYQFASMPPGLNQDEAATGYEAWSLAHYGTDINGVSWPVHLISWGSGSNASYSYFAIPFVAYGLSPATIRLPMLVCAIASLPLIGYLIRRLFDERAAWAAVAVVALSPWHVMLSRWALDCNILPFLFLCGLALLVRSIDANRKLPWLILACVMFGVSTYSYGAAYVAVPLFVLTALLMGRVVKIFATSHAFLAAFAFLLSITPIALFVLVNAFQWDSVRLGGVTAPRLPVAARFSTQLADGPFAHLDEFMNLMVEQRDGTVYNVTDPYGVLYSSVFFLLAAGFVIGTSILAAQRRLPPMRFLIPLWIIVSIPAGILQAPNINRINLLLMGMIVAAGLGLAALDKRIRGVLAVGLLSLLTFFSFFVHDYFTTQRDKIAPEFFDGFLPALSYARNNTISEGRICVTEMVNMPHVYALFGEPQNPQDYLKNIQYADPTAAFRQVVAYGRYTFGLQRCDLQNAKVIVARNVEKVSAPFLKKASFGAFDVYIPVSSAFH